MSEDITAPAIDRQPGQPEVYYFDHPTRLRVLEKQQLADVPAKPVRKATKKSAKKKA